MLLDRGLPHLSERDAHDEALRRLMTAYQGGDVAAFDVLYSSLATPLRRYLAGLRRDGAGVDDLLQETFLRMHKARHSYDPALPLSPWVYAIARHVFLMDLRRRSRRRESAVPADSEPAAATSVGTPWAGAEVQRLLGRIERERRETLVLHHLRGLRFDEIAARLGISEGAARVRAHRAMQALRRLLGRRTR